MKKIFFILAFCLSCAVLYAQDAYYSDFNPDRDMTPSVSENTFFSRGVQYGGWATPALGIRDDGDTKTTVMAAIFRLWAKSYLWDNAFIYVRGKDSLSIPINSDELENKNRVDLDVAYIEAKFWDGVLKLGVGRKYFTMGTGLVMNGRGDGLEVTYDGAYLGARAFASYSGLFQKDENPYKISSADYADGAKRLFAGGVLSTGVLPNQNFYVYGMNQKDFAKEKTSRYDSLYWGVGAKGVLFSALDYYGEFIYEMGKSYDDVGEKKDIAAMAIDAGLSLRLPFITEPVIIAQYSFGSGDNDRIQAANTAGEDAHFVSFGTFNGGLGLNPILGNLHVIRAGFSFQPFDQVPLNFIRRMTLVAKYSYYMKDKPSVPINGGEGEEPERYVGQGADAVLRWKIFSDLSLFASYGIFLPGKAYNSGESNRQFFLCGANISF